MMRWLCCVVFLSIGLQATIRQDEEAIEDKIHRLEIESGIELPPERTSFNIFGDFIYWKTSLDGVAWATTAEVVNVVNGGESFDDFKTRMVHFDYSPAFQIGAGVGLPYDHWDVATRWLRTFSTGRDHARGVSLPGVGDRVIFDSNGLVVGLITPPFPDRAKAKCHVHLDVVDLVLGRTFLWSRFFSFRPFAGVRGAWLRLKWDISFTMPIRAGFPAAQSFTTEEIHNQFNAGGFVGGFESKWNIYKGFGLFSYASASLIYGKSSEKTMQEFFLVPPFLTTALEQNFSAKNSTHTVKGVFDIGVGLKWERTFSKHCHLLFDAGYDFFYWPAVTQKTVTQFTRVRDRADLSFQGLVLGGRWDF